MFLSDVRVKQRIFGVSSDKACVMKSIDEKVLQVPVQVGDSESDMLFSDYPLLKGSSTMNLLGEEANDILYNYDRVG